MKKIMFFLLLLIFQLPAKVLIITHSHNRPEFIAMQYSTFKKFLMDDYEYVVFNDARDIQMEQQINNACAKLDVRAIRIPQEIHMRPYLPRECGDNVQQNNVRHANNIHYSLDVLGWEHDGVVAIMDSDMFLIRSFSIEDYMKDIHIASFTKRAPQNISCLCPVICFFSMNTLPNKKELNFNCGRIKDWMVDSGGFTYYYLEKYKNLKIKKINALYSHQLFLGDNAIGREADNVSKEVKQAFYENIGFAPKEIQFLLNFPHSFEFYLDNIFLHYRDGSNDTRQSQEFCEKKLNIIHNFINDILQD